MIDINKKYQTRDGREVVIHTTQGKGDFPVIGQIRCSTGNWIPECWTEDGIAPGYSSSDLISVPEKIEGWINVYESREVGILHGTKGSANECGNSYTRKKIACIHISFEEGEGLEGENL